jgi:hypothetical protein
MDKAEFEFKTRLIKRNFKDNRTITCPAPEHLTRLDENVHPGGDIFTTEDGKFIDFEFQKEDFDEVELAKYIDFAENLYEKHHKHVSVYILCPKHINICVKEHRIISDADFTIKLSCSQEDYPKMILDILKEKIRNKEILDKDDLIMAERLPLWCAKKDRNYYRVESLKIINRYSH